MSQKPSKTDMGAGLNLKSPDVQSHPSGPPRHGELGQAERGMSMASTFLSGVLAINAAQFIGLPFKMIDPKFYNDYMAFTKQSFAVLVTTLTQWWSPTQVRVSGDTSMPGQLFRKPDGSLECKFPSRIVLMANHQLYTDWLYLWWIAYTNKMAGHVYIILKESLRNIPLIGWGAQFYNFIFLARNWETDKPRFKEHLDTLSNPSNPMWLIIFPEGTNLSAITRESSKRWAEKNGIQDMRHQLLPRSTGLRFCLQNLRKSTDWLYDCTIGYEGVPPGQYGQDIYTLQSSFFEGRPPKSVNMHWRRFRISSIPVDDPDAFEIWLRNRWKEKDHFLDFFSRTGHFPASEPWKASDPKKIAAAKSIEAQVKSGSWGEFLAIFAPVTAFLTVLFLFYGASVGSLFGSNGKNAQAQEKGRLVNGTLAPSAAKQTLKNARAAAGSEASGATGGRPQYGEWDAIRNALSKENLGGMPSFAPKAPSTGDIVSGHRSFSAPGTRKAATTTDAGSTAAKKSIKVDLSNEALKAMLAKHLGKAESSKQLATQTIKLANGKVIRANAPETTSVQEQKPTVRLANGLLVGANSPQSSIPTPSKSTASQASSTRAPAAPKAPARTTKTPSLQTSAASARIPGNPKPVPAPTSRSSAKTTSTPSLASGQTRSVSSIATPPKAPSATPAKPAPKPATPAKPTAAKPAKRTTPPAAKAAPQNAPQKQAPAQKEAAKPGKPTKLATAAKGKAGIENQSKAAGYRIPLTVEPTSRGPKEKTVTRKAEAMEKRKDAAKS